MNELDEVGPHGGAAALTKVTIPEQIAAALGRRSSPGGSRLACDCARWRSHNVLASAQHPCVRLLPCCKAMA